MSKVAKKVTRAKSPKEQTFKATLKQNHGKSLFTLDFKRGVSCSVLFQDKYYLMAHFTYAGQKLLVQFPEAMLYKEFQRETLKAVLEDMKYHEFTATLVGFLLDDTVKCYKKLVKTKKLNLAKPKQTINFNSKVYSVGLKVAEDLIKDIPK